MRRQSNKTIVKVEIIPGKTPADNCYIRFNVQAELFDDRDGLELRSTGLLHKSDPAWLVIFVSDAGIEEFLLDGESITVEMTLGQLGYSRFAEIEEITEILR